MQKALSGTSPSAIQADVALELLRAENRILELLARGAPLSDILDALALTAEAFIGENSRSAILLLDQPTGRLLHGAAPNLPASYNEAIHGLQIGPNVGTCGRAAFLNDIVITTDISNDPRWEQYKHLALANGLRSAWSTPISSSGGEVLGTFGVYYDELVTPSDYARDLVQLLSRTAALAIERKRAERENAVFQQQIEALYRTGLSLSSERELQKVVQAATDAARELCGAEFGAFFYNVIDHKGESYMLYTLSGVEKEKFSSFPMPRNTEVFAPTFRGEGVVRSGNICKDPRYGKNAPRKGMPEGHIPVVSYLAVPVISRTGSVLGGLFFGHSQPDVFTANSERLITSVAAQAAIALDNAHLHENLTKQLKLAEEVQQRLSIAQRTARLATWEWDLETSEVKFTPGSAEIYGLPLEQMRTLDDWLKQVHPDDRDEVSKRIEAVRKRGEEYGAEYRVFRDGTVHWVLSRGHVTREPETGQPLTIVGLSMDITERKKSEEALRQSEKLAATGRLAATIAHEINNPLEAVTNFIYLAKSSPDLAEDVRHQLDIADQELGRVTHIAQQTLGFYRDTSGPVEVDVSETITNVLALFYRKMIYKSLEAIPRLHPEVKVRALQGELRQVLSNLVSNAIDASNQGSKIFVRARTLKRPHAADVVQITVADQGHGISAASRDHIFAPFFTTKTEVGTGLGLWVTKGMVEKHGGKIRFRSRAGTPSGTVFQVLLPANGSGLARPAEAK